MSMLSILFEATREKNEGDGEEDKKKKNKAPEDPDKKEEEGNEGKESDNQNTSGDDDKPQTEGGENDDDDSGSDNNEPDSKKKDDTSNDNNGEDDDFSLDSDDSEGDDSSPNDDELFGGEEEGVSDGEPDETNVQYNILHLSNIDRSILKRRLLGVFQELRTSIQSYTNRIYDDKGIALDSDIREKQITDANQLYRQITAYLVSRFPYMNYEEILYDFVAFSGRFKEILQTCDKKSGTT